MRIQLAVRTNCLPRDYPKQRRKMSTMPEGLLDTFNRQEILDLLAFVQFGGKEVAE